MGHPFLPSRRRHRGRSFSLSYIRAAIWRPYTLDQAYPFVRKKTVALGFADILFHVEDAYGRLLEKLTQDSTDVILGLFPADRPDKVDMVNLDNNGKITEIVVKPGQTDLHYTWGIAAWKPTFTQFMHEFLSRSVQTAKEQPELFVGDVIHASIIAGLHVQGTEISHEPYLDIGTSEDLLRAIRSALFVSLNVFTPISHCFSDKRIVRNVTVR